MIPSSRRRSAAALASAYLLGGIPWSQVVARRTSGVDLRRVGSGTVSGTGVYRVAGVGALLTAGVLDLGKGAAAVALARRLTGSDSRVPGAACGVVVSGHNWSPYLGLSGGRGIAPAMGALGVEAPAGFGVLLAGLTLGRLGGETAVGSLVAYAALPPVLARVHGRRGVVAAWSVLVPMLLKRLVGNARPQRPSAQVLLWRLLLDRDTRDKP